MIHDEKTTEIELPPHLVQKPKSIAQVQTIAVSPQTEFTVKDRRSQFSGGTETKRSEATLAGPWLIRLLAVISILVLSLLVF